eukprot:scpid96097/ scgid32907/ 
METIGCCLPFNFGSVSILSRFLLELKVKTSSATHCHSFRKRLYSLILIGPCEQPIRPNTCVQLQRLREARAIVLLEGCLFATCCKLFQSNRDLSNTMSVAIGTEWESSLVTALSGVALFVNILFWASGMGDRMVESIRNRRDRIQFKALLRFASWAMQKKFNDQNKNRKAVLKRVNTWMGKDSTDIERRLPSTQLRGLTSDARRPGATVFDFTEITPTADGSDTESYFIRQTSAGTTCTDLVTECGSYSDRGGSTEDPIAELGGMDE